jgi:hypothetical protein
MGPVRSKSLPPAPPRPHSTFSLTSPLSLASPGGRQLYPVVPGLDLSHPPLDPPLLPHPSSAEGQHPLLARRMVPDLQPWLGQAHGWLGRARGWPSHACLGRGHPRRRRPSWVACVAAVASAMAGHAHPRPAHEGHICLARAGGWLASQRRARWLALSSHVPISIPVPRTGTRT